MAETSQKTALRKEKACAARKREQKFREVRPDHWRSMSVVLWGGFWGALGEEEGDGEEGKKTGRVEA